MKVLHILNSILPSGAETMLAASADCWHNCELHALATQAQIGGYADTMRDKGYTIHHIWNSSALKKHMEIWRFLRKECFDVVHIHVQSQSVLYAIDARLAGCRVVIRTVHNNFRFVGLLKCREQFTRRLMRWMGVRFVAISKGVADNEWKEFRNKSKVIYNWCDSRFDFVAKEEKRKARRELGIGEDTFVLVSVGNCSENKNHKMILEALASIRGREKLLYCHVGAGDEEERKIAKDKGVSDNVWFVGAVSPDIYLYAADCYVMPSHYEGLSIAAIEALRCGLPAIFTDVPGLREFKSPEFDNVIFIPLSAEALRDRLQKLMQRPGENSLGQSIYAGKLFDMHINVEKYLELYHRK